MISFGVLGTLGGSATACEITKTRMSQGLIENANSRCLHNYLIESLSSGIVQLGTLNGCF